MLASDLAMSRAAVGGEDVYLIRFGESPAVNASSTSVASRWFGVRAEYEDVGRSQKFRNAVKEFFLGFVTLGFTFGSFDPKRFCDVILFRRDTGAAVVLFRYSTLEPASLHAHSLASRLNDMQVYDFCREVGIPIEVVCGEGEDPDDVTSVEWFPITHEQRKPVPGIA